MSFPPDRKLIKDAVVWGNISLFDLVLLYQA